jgi:MFS family permease
MKSGDQPSKSSQRKRPAAWIPLRYPVFRLIWIANVASNIGTWVHNTAAAWLMTSLTMSPLMISLVQTATTLPIFLLALPAGALADVLDRRRLILYTQVWMLAAAAALGVLTLTGHTTPWMLLTLTLLLSLGAAINAPSWQAIMPELVPRPDLPAAIALNSAGFNLARAVGPALGGVVVGIVGTGQAFLINAASFLCVIGAIVSWRRALQESRLPAEDIMGAMRAGIRYIRNAPLLDAVLVRGGAFIICAVAMLALLPVLARHDLGLDAFGYGLMLGFFGAGAVAGAAILPSIQSKASADLIVGGATVLFAAALAALAFVNYLPILMAALAAGGLAWLVVLSSLNASVQAVVPAWVLGRALSAHMLIIFGGMAGGSALWGVTASFIGTRSALAVAAVGLVAGILATVRYRLALVGELDLTPSRHWSEPAAFAPPSPNEGPVLVMVEYLIDSANSHDFLLALGNLRRLRLRDGAIRWELFVDAADPKRYMESFVVSSWIEHLRQHERITVADRDIENLVHSFHVGDKPPRVTHLLAKNIPGK